MRTTSSTSVNKHCPGPVGVKGHPRPGKAVSLAVTEGRLALGWYSRALT